MKLLLFFVLITALQGCYGGREIQTEMVNAELVKIDTVYRYSNAPEKVLTWRSADNILYTNYVSMQESYVVGSKILVMVRK